MHKAGTPFCISKIPDLRISKLLANTILLAYFYLSKLIHNVQFNVRYPVATKNPNHPPMFRRAWLDTRPALKFAFEWKRRRPHKEKNLVMKRSRRSSIRRTRRAKNRKRLSVCTLYFNHVWMCPDFYWGERIFWLKRYYDNLCNSQFCLILFRSCPNATTQRIKNIFLRALRVKTKK